MSRAFQGVKQAERAELAREFLAGIGDEELLETTEWKVTYCWELTRFDLAETLLIAEKLKRSLITLADLTPDQRRRQIDPADVDLKAIAQGPIMDPAELYLPAGKLSMEETRRREQSCVLASGMSASGQDPKGLEAKPASPTREAGDAQ